MLQSIKVVEQFRCCRLVSWSVNTRSLSTLAEDATNDDYNWDPKAEKSSTSARFNLIQVVLSNGQPRNLEQSLYC